MDPPASFQDVQIDGPFKRMVHAHSFEQLPSGTTRMVDEFQFVSPGGPLGSLVDTLVLERYMTNLLESRNQELRSIAEELQ